MKKVALLLVLALVVVAGIGCYGTRSITRGLDDWGNEMQTNNAWLAQPIGWFVLPIATMVTGMVDGFIDAYYFWSDHAWTNVGTPYVHKVVPAAVKK
jgi:hypothetical protein